jgi:hypothetical protein
VGCKVCSSVVRNAACRGLALLILNLGARRGWVISTTRRPLYHRERPGTRCRGGRVGPGVGLDMCEKSRPHRDSIPGPSSLCIVLVISTTSNCIMSLTICGVHQIISRLSNKSPYDGWGILHVWKREMYTCLVEDAGWRVLLNVMGLDATVIDPIKVGL